MLITTDLVAEVSQLTALEPDLVGSVLWTAESRDPFAWQRMGLAPRDGTPIMAYIPAPENEQNPDYCPIVPIRWNKEKERWEGCNKNSYPFSRKLYQPIAWCWPCPPGDLAGFEPDTRGLMPKR